MLAERFITGYLKGLEGRDIKASALYDEYDSIFAGLLTYRGFIKVVESLTHDPTKNIFMKRKKDGYYYKMKIKKKTDAVKK